MRCSSHANYAVKSVVNEYCGNLSDGSLSGSPAYCYETQLCSANDKLELDFHYIHHTASAADGQWMQPLCMYRKCFWRFWRHRISCNNLLYF